MISLSLISYYFL